MRFRGSNALNCVGANAGASFQGIEMTGKSVTFDSNNSDWLLCPGCGEHDLHHDQVTVFERETEDAPSRATEIDGTRVRVLSDGRGNPSSRRGGIAIRFWCEHCSAVPELTLAQHKGTTLMEWRLAARDLRVPWNETERF
jgi:hypothetical protein